MSRSDAAKARRCVWSSKIARSESVVAMIDASKAFARKTKHPDTGDVTIACNGFNHKNIYDRQTPCDQDFLRKFSRATDPEKLTNW